MEIEKVDILEDQMQTVEAVRFTPTGKISHAKTRVYTQRYRKDWEQMPDFKGWLTCVPEQQTRAYCLYCRKDLHAHRLSLLKHMCTIKHQRSAQNYQDHQSRKRNQYNSATLKNEVEADDKEEYLAEEEIDGNIYIAVERLENYDDSGDHLESENDFDKLNDDNQYEESDGKESASKRTMEYQMVEEEIEAPEEENEMMDLTDVEVKHVSETFENEESEEMMDKPMIIHNVSKDSVALRSIKVKEHQTARKSTPKLVGISTSSLPNFPMAHVKNLFMSNNFKSPAVTLTRRSTSEVNESQSMQVTEEIEIIKQISHPGSGANQKTMTKTLASKVDNVVKKASVTTYVIDNSRGLPISGLPVSLYKLVDGKWTFMSESLTLASGHCNDLMDKNKLNGNGRYKLHFDVDKYFSTRKIETMFPFIEIVFDIKNTNQYHIPVLLSPFGYTTYRGCDK